MTRPANEDQFNGHHTYDPKSGYQPAEYVHQEYPKVVGQDDAKNDIVATDAAHEAELLAALAEKSE